MSFDSDWDKIKQPVQNPSQSGIQGTYPDLSLTNVVSAGTYGNSEQVPVITVSAQGRVTDVTTQPVVPPDLNPPPNQNLSQSFGSSTQVPVLTVDAKGRVTQISQVMVSFPMPPTEVVQVTTSFTVQPSHFGKTLVLEQADAPFWSSSIIDVSITPSVLSSVGVGTVIVIRVNPYATAVFRLDIGGDRSVTVELAAGESVTIQKVGANEYGVRDVVNVLDVGDSYFGYLNRLYLDHRLRLRRSGARSVERLMSFTFPGLANGVATMRRCYNIDGRLFVEPWTSSDYNVTRGYSVAPDGAFLDLTMWRHQYEPAAPVAAMFIHGDKLWRVRVSESPAPLYWQYLFAHSGYSSAPSSDPQYNFYGRFHQYVWYGSQVTSAYGFLNVPSSVYSIYRPVPYQVAGDPYCARWVRWSTSNVPDIQSKVSVLTVDPVLTARIAHDVYLVTSRALSMYTTENGVWVFRLTFYLFDGRWAGEAPNSPVGALDRMFTDTMRTITIPLQLRGWDAGIPYFPAPGNVDGAWSSLNNGFSPLIAVYASHGILYFVVEMRRRNYPGPHYGILQVPYYIPASYPVVTTDDFLRLPSNIGLCRSSYLYNYEDKACHIVDAGINWGMFSMRIERGLGPTSNPWSSVDTTLLSNWMHGLSAMYPTDIAPLPGLELPADGFVAGSYVVIRQDGGHQYMRTYTGRLTSLRAPLADAGNSRYTWTWRTGSPIPGEL